MCRMTLNDGPFDLGSAAARPNGPAGVGRLAAPAAGVPRDPVTFGPIDFRAASRRRMEFGVVLSTVIVLALMLATVAGLVVARILMHAADTRSQ